MTKDEKKLGDLQDAAPAVSAGAPGRLGMYSDAGYGSIVAPKPIRRGMEEFDSPAPDMPSGYDPNKRQFYEAERGSYINAPDNHKGGVALPIPYTNKKIDKTTVNASETQPSGAIPSQRYFRHLAEQGRYSDNPNDPRYGNRAADIRGAMFDGAYQNVPEGVILPAKDSTGARAPYTMTTADLVDLYGQGAKSNLSDEENLALIASRTIPENSRMIYRPGAFTEKNAKFAEINRLPTEREKFSIDPNEVIDTSPRVVGNTWEEALPGGANRTLLRRSGTDAELAFGAPNHESTPGLDFSGPSAMLASALPYAAQIGRNRARAAEAARQAQVFQHKYGVDASNYLKRLELEQNRPKIAAETIKANAEAVKAGAEAQAAAGKTATGSGKLSLEDRKHIIEMFQSSPEAFSALYGDPTVSEPDAATKSQWLRKAIGMDAPAATAKDANAGTGGQPQITREHIDALGKAAYEMVRSGRKTRQEVDAELKRRGVNPSLVWGNA